MISPHLAHVADPTPLQDLEHRIRERGVRVEERLALLRILAREDASERLSKRQDELLAAVRQAAADLKRELS